MTFKFEFDLKSLQLILNALNKLPREESNPLASYIEQEATKQLAEEKSKEAKPKEVKAPRKSKEEKAA